MAEKKKKHGFKHTHVTHHSDGSATVKHEHEDGKSHVEHAVANLDGVHDSMEQHLGEPNDGEQAEAMPAGLPGAAPASAGPGGM